LWNFWYFGQTLMDNYKLVMISILYLKHDKKIWFCISKRYAWKTFRLRSHAQKKNIFFLCFWNEEFFLNFWIYFQNFEEKSGIFNIRSVSYSVSLQFDIRQKLLEKHVSDTNNFKKVPEILLEVFEFFKGLFS
jgi:hypothetical protein